MLFGVGIGRRSREVRVISTCSVSSYKMLVLLVIRMQEGGEFGAENSRKPCRCQNLAKRASNMDKKARVFREGCVTYDLLA